MRKIKSNPSACVQITRDVERERERKGDKVIKVKFLKNEFLVC